jgi:hypothetical protein
MTYFWLFIVTYMQHHHDDAKVYKEGAWNFLDGGLETVDRKMGWGVDWLHHRITDCHLVHHLFFTQIPHYNLRKATDHIAPLLKQHGVYKLTDHTTYPVISYVADFCRTYTKLGYTEYELVAPTAAATASAPMSSTSSNRSSSEEELSSAASVGPSSTCSSPITPLTASSSSSPAATGLRHR